MSRPQLVRTRAELDEALAGAPVDRAVVMTMGALHEGHLALVRAARARAEHVVVTIFVNPLQFGPAEDLATYPRDLYRDLDVLDGLGVDLVFAPAVEEVYPAGDPIVRVSAGRIGEVLEGARRPGHLDGVLTVVLKLVHLVRPRVAVFGQKDAQQLIAVRRMVADLDLAVEVLAVPTVRASDGLALSSRNAGLSPWARDLALALSAALFAGAQRAPRGAPAVLSAAGSVLDAAPELEVDYLVLMDPSTAQEVGRGWAGSAVLAVAARAGGVRLIDNVVVELDGTSGTLDSHQLGGPGSSPASGAGSGAGSGTDRGTRPDGG